MIIDRFIYKRFQRWLHFPISSPRWSTMEQCYAVCLIFHQCWYCSFPSYCPKDLKAAVNSTIVLRSEIRKMGQWINEIQTVSVYLLLCFTSSSNKIFKTPWADHTYRVWWPLIPITQQQTKARDLPVQIRHLHGSQCLKCWCSMVWCLCMFVQLNSDLCTFFPLFYLLLSWNSSATLISPTDDLEASLI